MNNTDTKILIVDDENDLREALRIAITKVGYTVLEAKNGEEALEHIATHNPHLVLLDITMPGMSGLAVLREIRKNQIGSHKNTPVLLLTNADDPENITRGIGLNSDDYIIKSQTSLEDIVKKVNQHVLGYHD